MAFQSSTGLTERSITKSGADCTVSDTVQQSSDMRPRFLPSEHSTGTLARMTHAPQASRECDFTTVPRADPGPA